MTTNEAMRLIAAAQSPDLAAENARLRAALEDAADVLDILGQAKCRCPKPMVQHEECNPCFALYASTSARAALAQGGGK